MRDARVAVVPAPRLRAVEKKPTERQRAQASVLASTLLVLVKTKKTFGKTVPVCKIAQSNRKNHLTCLEMKRAE